MKLKMYLAIVVTVSSILAFALIATTTTAAGTPFSIFENVVAQEGAINPTEDLVNDTQVDKDRGVNDTQIDKDRGTTRSSTDFSAINDTMSN
jgi:hypothetical protein